MKTPVFLLFLLALAAIRVDAGDTNLNPILTQVQPLNLYAEPTNVIQTVTINRPLDEVIAAMQTYYFSTNYHRSASAVYGTNAVPGVSYTFKIADCAFDQNIGVFGGKMTATRINTDSTKLELFWTGPVPQDSKNSTSVKQIMSRTLDYVSKLARKENVPVSQTWP